MRCLLGRTKMKRFVHQHLVVEDLFERNEMFPIIHRQSLEQSVPIELMFYRRHRVCLVRRKKNTADLSLRVR